MNLKKVVNEIYNLIPENIMEEISSSIPYDDENDEKGPVAVLKKKDGTCWVDFQPNRVARYKDLYKDLILRLELFF